MKYITLFVLLLTSLVSTAAFAYESPRMNIIHSQRYEYLIHHNSAFRRHRIVKECGPLVHDPVLHQDCIASFYMPE